MFRDVEAFALDFFGGAQTDRVLDRQEGNRTDQSGPDQRDAHACGLDAQLLADALEGADATQRGMAEDGAGERTHDAADAVHAEDVERVVIPERLLEARA